MKAIVVSIRSGPQHQSVPVTLNDNRYKDAIATVYAVLAPYRLKGAFCEGAPPPQEALPDHEDAYLALQNRPWAELGAGEAGMLIEILPYLSDQEFLSAFPPITELLLKADQWTDAVQKFLTHMRDISKGQIYRNVPYDFYAVLLNTLTALEAKYAEALEKKQEPVAHLKKTREWALIRTKAKR